MSGQTYTDQEIGDFLGNIELHLLNIKNFWAIYLDGANDQATRDAAKNEVIECINHVQMILNSIESSLGITLPNSTLTTQDITQFGIMQS